MCGQYGGGGFVLIYILCLLLLGLPVMTMEFAVGRAAQASPIHMYQKLERKGQKWHLHGYIAFFGNIALMAFYTVVTGWIIYYFVRFLTGRTEDLGFVTMITNPGVNVTYLAVTVIVAGQVLGMTKTQIFFKITLLQVIKRIIPPMGNEFINLVKDTALARTIAVYEVLWMGEKFIKSKGIIWPLFYTAVFYLVFNGLLTLLFGWIEKKMDYFK